MAESKLALADWQHCLQSAGTMQASPFETVHEQSESKRGEWSPHFTLHYSHCGYGGL